MPTLFDPIQLGAITAPNRILMAPLTRSRATPDHVPTAVMAKYYSQRASAGLIISEATGISREGTGWPYVPGLWSDAQVDAWRPVTEAVHAAGGRIFAQLWHMGRLVHPDFLGGQSPISASATTAPGEARTYDGKLPYQPARAIPTDEIPRLIGDFHQAARNAVAAGFDGVQLHAANGYLIDQFLRDSTNRRTDSYGGAIENRIRLLVEVTQALIDAAGADRTAVRLSPNSAVQADQDSDPIALFTAAAAALDDLGIAFLELREPGPDSTFFQPDSPPVGPLIRKTFSRPLVLNSDYRGDSAQAVLDGGAADAISFGRPFIANPDLPYRIANNLPLQDGNPATYYAPGDAGYIDYPTAA